MKKKPQRFPPPIASTEVIGLDHPLMSPEMARKIFGAQDPAIEVPASALNDAVMLIAALADPTGNAQQQIAVDAPKRVILRLNGVFDKALRAQQEKNLQKTGKARP